jgi:hypothetical protein
VCLRERGKERDSKFFLCTVRKGKNSKFYACKVILGVDLSLMEVSFLANFYKENEYLFNKITKPDITPEEVTELWHKLAKAVIIENELARQ